MFNAEYDTNKKILFLSGNFDASKAEFVKDILQKVENTLTVDMSGLNFISSAGLGVIIMTYNRLKEKGYDIYLINLSEHVRKVFKLSLLDKIFKIE